MPLVRALTVHSDYRCRHSGACCTAGWPIPVEDDQTAALGRALRDGRLTPARSVPDGALFVSAPDGGASIGCANGACVFYESGTAGLCAIHRQLGEAYLPSSCRHFPRVALLDGRGVSITLSHYCPTAAGMLFREDVPLAIVENPPAFPPTADYEGLDARAVLPPLVRPGLLWDLEAYSRWEREAVALLARRDLGPEQSLDLLQRAAMAIETWRPGCGPLEERVSVSFARLGSPAEAGGRWGSSAPVVNRYLAARLFASWVPYQSDRLLSLVESLQRTLDLLAGEAARQELPEAIRATDLRIVHGGC